MVVLSVSGRTELFEGPGLTRFVLVLLGQTQGFLQMRIGFGGFI